MLNKNLFSWSIAILMLDIIYSVNCQSKCDDFYSPKTLTTDGTRLGTLVFPLSGGKYKPNQDCKWNIQTSTSGMVVKLQITSSDLQGPDIHGDCNSDYVDIFDVKNGENLFLGRFCSSESGRLYESTGQKMVVSFTSNTAAEFSGFTASFQAVIERGNELDSHSTMLLAICIPVGVILLVLTIPLSWKIMKVYRQKSSSNRASSQRQGCAACAERCQRFRCPVGLLQLLPCPPANHNATGAG
ncbi:Deleted in malignant brain tumors 1 protein [Bulinus truncatus]|nr:Deleted in malignant brain tumors 1 protein [Bulinus truncatus]